MLVKGSPVWRTAADIEDTWQTIEIIRRVGADLLPALVAADGPVIEAYRSVPGHADVPFHIAVEAEEVAHIIHPQVRRISATGSDTFPFLAVGRYAKHRGL